MWRCIVLLLCIGGLAGSALSDAASPPKIEIKDVPPRHPGGEDPEFPIGGTVGGVDPRQCLVVVYALSNKWWIQPQKDNWETLITEDLTWETTTHGGTRYAALLVKQGYKAALTLPTRKPPQKGGQVLDIMFVDGASKQ